MVELISILTCPVCKTEHEETMPVDACQFFYDCPSCGTILRPLQGDDCVFCSFGTVDCPDKQLEARKYEEGTDFKGEKGAK